MIYKTIEEFIVPYQIIPIRSNNFDRIIQMNEKDRKGIFESIFICISDMAVYLSLFQYMFLESEGEK